MVRNPAPSPELLKRRALLLMGFLQQTQPPWKFSVCSDQPELAVLLRTSPSRHTRGTAMPQAGEQREWHQRAHFQLQ